MASEFDDGLRQPPKNNPLQSYQKVEKQEERQAAISPEGSGRKLDELVAQEILPRLLVAHSEDASRPVSSKPHIIYATEAEHFAPMPLTHDIDELLLQIDAFLERGVSVESVYVDLLAKSAHKMGEYWEEDSCDFVDVTMGLWRLQELMREIAERFPVQRDAAAPRRSVLFTPMPGEQHSFGSLMVEEVFARAGWDSEALIEPQRAEFLQILAERSFDLVGLTVSCDCPSGDISSLITAIRSVSRCRSVKVIVGGRAINANPGLASLVGADGTAADARSALVLADRIVVESKRVDCLTK